MNTESIIVVSTAHLTEGEAAETLPALAKREPSLVWEREYGFMVCGAAINHLSPRLAMVVNSLQDDASDWVLFDNAGELVDTLPTFDW